MTPEVDQEAVAQMFKRYDLLSLPVVDEHGGLLGQITHDDVVDVLEEEADEDFLHMAGASAEEPELVYTRKVFRIATVRLPWLLSTVFGGVVSGMLLWRFRMGFPEKLTLLTFIPVIAAMCGNMGTQSATIVVRGFATGRIGLGTQQRLLAKELAVGLIMGGACGLLVGLVAWFWHESTLVGLVVGLAMAASLAVSGLVGVAVPFLFRGLGIDPAIGAGPLVTASNDVLGITIYYLVALSLLS